MTVETIPPITRNKALFEEWSYNRGYDNTRSSMNPVYTRTEKRVSDRTPGFHDPHRVGKLKPLPFTYELVERWYPDGDYRQLATGYVDGTAQPGSTDYYHYHAVGPRQAGWSGATCATGFYDPLNAQVVNELLGKIKDTKANLAELFAERKKTAQMVGDTAINLALSVRALRHGDFRKAAVLLGVKPRGRAVSRYRKHFIANNAKAVASGWLQLKYGWQPLLSDIYGSLETLAAMNESPMYVTTKHRRTNVYPLQRTIVTYDSTGGVKTTRTVAGTKKSTIQYSCTYWKQPTTYSTLSKLGVTNPVLLAWELVPFSFVVDWFIPIGNYLDIQDATSGLTFYTGYRTLFSKVDWKSELHTTGRTKATSGTNYYYFEDFSEAYREVRCVREVLTDFPSPCLPRFKALKQAASFTHMLNGISLLAQTFLTSKRLVSLEHNRLVKLGVRSE